MTSGRLPLHCPGDALLSSIGFGDQPGLLCNGEKHERAVLKKLLGEMNLEGLLIQADALHTQKPFFDSSRSRAPTSC